MTLFSVRVPVSESVDVEPRLTDAQEIRAGLEAVAHAIGALAVAVRPSLDADGCQHPEESRDYSAATMGRIQWTCACGYHFDPKGGT